VASAYSVRPVPDARVSAPLTWDEVSTCDPADFTVRTMVARFEGGDPSKGIDQAVGSLHALLETSKRQERDGDGDAPWPPHFDKQPDEPARVRPSAAKKSPSPKESPAASSMPVAFRGRRPTKPLLVIARAADKADALRGLERWTEKYPEAAAALLPADVLVDSMRGRYTTWTRVRVNLHHVPEALRPAPEPPDPDYDPWSKG
jgi:hypothetical protein